MQINEHILINTEYNSENNLKLQNEIETDLIK